MKRLALLLALAAAAAAWPSAAAAKELVQAKVCGTNGCNTVTDRETLRMLPAGGQTPGAPPPAAPFYTVALTHAGEGERFTFVTWYVPSSRMIAFRDDTGATSWFPISGAKANGVMQTLARGLAPFPPPTLTRVTVDGRPVADPRSYLRLLSVRAGDDGLPKATDWQMIRFSSARPTPWTNGATYVTYSPSANTLWRGPDLIRLPDALAERLEARESLSIPSDGFPWRYLVLALAVLGAVAGAAAFGIGLAGRTRDVAHPKTTAA